jgi:hypothetical protein
MADMNMIGADVLATLRAADPALAKAEQAHARALGDLAAAREDLRRALHACDTLPAAVVSGAAPAAALDDAIRNRQSAALRIAPLEAVARSTAAALTGAVEAALRSLATTIRTERQRLDREAAPLRSKLAKIAAADLELLARAQRVRDLAGVELLASHDLGQLVDWPLPLSAEIAHANVAHSAAAAAWAQAHPPAVDKVS